MNITIYKSILEITNGYVRPVEYVFKRIREGNSREIVEKVRASGDGEIKKRLPVINFQGVFKERKDSGITEFSGLMPLDFDKFETLSELQECREKLQADKYTFALFTSPSGNGLKVIVKIPTDGASDYKNYFNSLRDYYQDSHFDISSSNISRLCFESFDADIFVNPESDIYTDKVLPDFVEIGTQDTIFAVTSENRIIQNLLIWFNKKFGVGKGERNNNLFKLAAALNAYGINKREGLNVLLEFTQQDFTPTEITAICNSAYRNIGEHGTRFFEDSEIKTKVKKHIRTGTKIGDIHKIIPEANIEQITQLADSMKNKQDAEDFWTTHNGNIRLSPTAFKKWLEQNQFSKHFPSNAKNYTFIKIDGSLVEDTNEKRIKDYVLEYLENRTDLGNKVYDYMAANLKFFTPDFLSILGSADVEIEQDTKDTCYLYYRNYVVKITADKIETLDYLELKGYVWKNQVIDRDYVKTDHHDSEYRHFIWKISGENEQRYNTLKSIIGYMLHSYKTEANNKAIILNDMVISENPNGGSGKGIFCNALKKLKKVSAINGKDHDFNKSFAYQTVPTDCQILVFDDVEKNFQFERLFSVITEGITIEYKNQGAVKLPVEKSPKIIISTNYTLKGNGGSHDRRRFEVEFSDFFNSNHTPDTYFGHLLFNDWDNREWNMFDNYMIQCAQLNLRYGLMKSAFVNISVRKFIADTSHDFYEYVKNHDVYTSGVKYSKKQAYELFLEDYNDYKKWLSQKKFKQWIELYAEQFGYDYYESANADLGRFFMLTKKQGFYAYN
jgi:hypothetical protein